MATRLSGRLLWPAPPLATCALPPPPPTIPSDAHRTAPCLQLLPRVRADPRKRERTGEGRWQDGGRWDAAAAARQRCWRPTCSARLLRPGRRLLALLTLLFHRPRVRPAGGHGHLDWWLLLFSGGWGAGGVAAGRAGQCGSCSQPGDSGTISAASCTPALQPYNSPSTHAVVVRSLALRVYDSSFTPLSLAQFSTSTYNSANNMKESITARWAVVLSCR